MTNKEIIEQLKSLKSHCEDFRNEEDCVWSKDVEAMEMAIEALEKQAAGEWIPVSDRLPEAEGVYLITSKVLDKTDVQYVFYQKNIEMFICNGIAIAWMPLPEPYKGESK